MSEVIIYSSGICPSCVQAKQLLKSKNITYREIRVDLHPEALTEMVEKSGGRRTVPQIFIGSQHVGGYDDLYALEKEEKLDSILEKV